MITKSIESSFNPSLKISPKALNIIRNYAIEKQPLECCGFIIIKNRYQILVLSENLHEDPERNFLIPREDIDYLFDQMSRNDFGKAVLFHSHKDNPYFSPKDTQMFEQMTQLYKISWLLYCLKTDSFYLKTKKGERENSLLQEDDEASVLVNTKTTGLKSTLITFVTLSIFITLLLSFTPTKASLPLEPIDPLLNAFSVLLVRNTITGNVEKKVAPKD